MRLRQRPHLVGYIVSVLFVSPSSIPFPYGAFIIPYNSCRHNLNNKPLAQNRMRKGLFLKDYLLKLQIIVNCVLVLMFLIYRFFDLGIRILCIA